MGIDKSKIESSYLGICHLIDGRIIDVYSEGYGNIFNPDIFNKSGNIKFNGTLVHNKNGPAIIWNSSYVDKYCYIEYGKYNRIDGPAIYNRDYPNFSYSYYLEGSFFTAKNFAEKTNHVICKYCENFCRQSCF